MKYADSKKIYIRNNWIYLIASIPFVEFLRVGRFIRLIRFFRILRIGALFGKQVSLLGEVFSKGTFNYVAILSMVIVLSGSTLLFFIEKNYNDNINTFYDSLWWSIVTITTVGYGDIYPATNAGRTVAALLMIFGLGIFSSLTAIITSTLRDNRDEKNVILLLEEINRKLSK